jgi:hypothetical protein
LHLTKCLLQLLNSIRSVSTNYGFLHRNLRIFPLASSELLFHSRHFFVGTK